MRPSTAWPPAANTSTAGIHTFVGGGDTQTFQQSGSASGVGDVVVRAKYRLTAQCLGWRDRRGGAARDGRRARSARNGHDPGSRVPHRLRAPRDVLAPPERRLHMVERQDTHPRRNSTWPRDSTGPSIPASPSSWMPSAGRSRTGRPSRSRTRLFSTTPTRRPTPSISTGDAAAAGSFRRQSHQLERLDRLPREPGREPAVDLQRAVFA